MRGTRAVVAGLTAVLLLAGLTPPSSAAPAPAPCARGWIALTFDDGPGPLTAAVLDVLAARDAPSTFFVVGWRVAAQPWMIRRMAEERHVVANHTYRHENLTTLSDAAIRSTVNATVQAITATGVRPIPVLRPPYGATNARVHQAVRAAGHTQLLWTADSRDWAVSSHEEVARRAIAGFADGAVLLFHDGNSGVHRTLRALPTIIDTARSSGYCFGVLDDAGRVVPPAPVAVQVAPGQELSGIGGETRFETAAGISRVGWPQGAADAVLVTGERAPDALSASVLAGLLEAPILLVAEGHLHAVVAEELARLGVERAYLIGPLSPAVEQAVSALGIATTRLSGADRYETSALIAAEAARLSADAEEPDADAGPFHMRADTSAVIVTTGEDFADALAASVLAAGLRHPILLTRPAGDRDRIAAALSELGAERTWVIGGPAAVPDDAVAGLPGVERIAGPVRAATAGLVADRSVRAGFGRDPVIASGQSFPDALSGGVLAARLNRPLLITAGARLSPEVHRWLAANGSSSVLLLGGPVAISAGVRCQLRTGLDQARGCEG